MRDRLMSSTLVQGDKVTAHNTSHLAESQNLEWEDCDLAYIHIGGGTMGAQGAGPTCFILWGQCHHKFSYRL